MIHLNGGNINSCHPGFGASSPAPHSFPAPLRLRGRCAGQMCGPGGEPSGEGRRALPYGVRLTINCLDSPSTSSGWQLRTRRVAADHRRAQAHFAQPRLRRGHRPPGGGDDEALAAFEGAGGGIGGDAGDPAQFLPGACAPQPTGALSTVGHIGLQISRGAAIAKCRELLVLSHAGLRFYR